MSFCWPELVVAVYCPADMAELAVLGVRFVKVLAMLATLSFLIIDVADALTRCSLLDRAVIPGNGRMSRVHTSDRRASSRALSPRDGAMTGTRLFMVDKD